jgi:hypothetical protein
MPPSLVEGESLLAVDVGAAVTRAVLFDVVEGQYRFVASGQAPTTAEAPLKDVAEGVRDAIRDLEAVTGRHFLDANRTLMIPSQPDGMGVDRFTATLSVGPTLRAVVVGLLSDVSIESARRLAETSYTQVMDVIDLNDRRTEDQQIDAVIRARPDLIIIAGGTDGGAWRSMRKTLEAIGLACYLMPAEKRPSVLFAGNQKLVNEVKTSLGSFSNGLRFAPNVRPSLETEDLMPAAKVLAELIPEIRKRQLKGIEELTSWSSTEIQPTSFGTGRIVQYLGKTYGTNRSILSVDIGAAAMTFAASLKGETVLSVFPQFGLGENLAGLLRFTDLDEIMKWLPLDASPTLVRDHIFRQALYPTSIAATKEDLVVSQTVARQLLHLSARAFVKGLRDGNRFAVTGLMPDFDIIIASGGLITSAPTAGQGLLLLLDGLQPVGVSTLILDQNNLLPLMGAIAPQNPLLPVQMIESTSFVNLATVVSPVCRASYGAPVLQAHLKYENGTETRLEVKYGGLEVIPLPANERGELSLRPLHRADVGSGPGVGRDRINVKGGALGVVIDARGRPLALPEDGVHRRDMIKKWMWTVGG